MFADPYAVPVDIASASETHPTALVSLTGNASVRIFTDTDAGGPRNLKISHSVVGKGTSLRNRHLARLESFVVEDTVENRSKPIALYVVADIPVGATSDQVEDLMTSMTGLLRGKSCGASGEAPDPSLFLDRWLQGEA